MQTTLRISLVQMDIVWENKNENLRRLEKTLKTLHGETDIVVLPEMFSTGFSMQSRLLSETVNGNTITTIKQWAAKYQITLTGSFIAREDDSYYNRAFFLTPEGEEFYYNKRHLFRMGDEPNNFTAGDKKTIIPYRGWSICLMVCYDLRFPIWCRNRSNEYDLLLFVANWPTSRRRAWETLLCARAIENLSYVCGVNRVGTDGYGLHYSGQSSLYNAKGENLVDFPDKEQGVRTVSIDISSLRSLRTKFPTWKDDDLFHLD